VSGESRPGQGGQRITDTSSVTPAGDNGVDDASSMEQVRKRWAAFELPMHPVADGMWRGQCPWHKSEYTVTVEEGPGPDDPVTIHPCPGGCAPEEISRLLSLNGQAKPPEQWTHIRTETAKKRFGTPDAADQYLRVVAALLAQGHGGRRSDVNGTAGDGRYTCPACGAPGDGHGLKVSVGATQPVVMHCYGCQAPVEEILAALGLTWADISRPLPPLTEFEYDGPDGKADETDPRPNGKATDTELATARRLAATFGDRIRYVVPWRKWLIWDGQRWKDDDTGQISRYAKKIADGIPTKKGPRFHTAAGIAAMINLAGTEPGIALAPETLDTDPYLVNCLNGTLDLRTLQLRPHDPADLITKLAGAAYHPDAVAPRFVEFLERIQPDPDMRGFLARLFGHALLGKVVEHILAILYGVGANGKTTLVEAVTKVFGDYARPIEPGLLIDRGDVHPTGVAALFALRLAITHETDEGRRLAEGTVKRLTGGDKITARRMREDFWDFEPSHSIVMHTNHKPIVRGTDEGIWRRLRFVPFAVAIPEDERDSKLPELLAGELDGILTWIIDGYRQWQDHGLAAPEQVTEATAEFRGESDMLALFLAERCNVDAGQFATVQSSVLFAAWVEWCKRENVDAGTQTRFSREMTKRGYDKGKDGLSHMVWKGLSLWNDVPD
jgi:putative DNA primase/helicase